MDDIGWLGELAIGRVRNGGELGMVGHSCGADGVVCCVVNRKVSNSASDDFVRVYVISIIVAIISSAYIMQKACSGFEFGVWRRVVDISRGGERKEGVDLWCVTCP